VSRLFDLESGHSLAEFCADFAPFEPLSGNTIDLETFRSTVSLFGLRREVFTLPDASVQYLFWTISADW
jgi:hypothetical protein